MRFKTVCISIVSLLLIVSFISCSQDKNKWKGSIEVEDGVTIIKNPEKPLYSEDALELEEDLTIGVVEGEEKYMFKNIYDVAVDKDENIYIVDLNLFEIRIFDKNGKYLRNLSQRGEGPGEYNYPMQIMISTNDEIVINDFLARQLIFFSLAGKFIKNIHIWEKYSRLLEATLDSEGWIIGKVFLISRENDRALVKFNPDDNQHFVLAEKSRKEIPLLEALSPSIMYSLSINNEIIWGDSSKYEVHILDNTGKIIKKILREYNPINIIKEEWQEDINRKFRGNPIPPIFEQTLPDSYPAFNSILTDESGRIYFGTFEKTQDGIGYYYDVFDAEGKYLLKKVIEGTSPVFKNGKLYVIHLDEDGYQYIKRYKVTWKI